LEYLIAILLPQLLHGVVFGAALGSRARAHVIQHYSSDACAQAYLDLYRSLVET